METAYRFHHYRLLPEQRQLLEGERPVKLGSRAFDMLLALVERRERVVNKHELMDLVWPRLVVEENNLQVQVLALRKLLGHGAISTIPGRGYRFTLPVMVGGEATEPPEVSSSTPAAAEPAGHGNLPPQPRQLFGRDDDLVTVNGLIEQHALVTVAGAGGIGKTVLAQGVAHQQHAQHGGGVWWVDLAAVSDPALVPSTVARALGLALEGTKDPTQAVLEALRGRAALLVLDNAEHLLGCVAGFAAALRGAAKGVRLLVTSQEVLHALDEQVFRLGPLTVPQGDELAEVQASGAVALFVARARAADPRFMLTADNRAAVADICRRLDGIPLAIELAAARVPLLGVQGIQQRLDERFRLLTAGARAVLRRHQTLRAALEWSHALLSAPEQVVFRRLGVFAGGFTMEAAQGVADDEHTDAWDVLEHLGALVDKSLVVAEGEPLPRYRMPETTRLYALERLVEAGETGPYLARHARTCMLMAEAAADEIRLQGQGSAALRRLDDERDNLFHALSWSDLQGMNDDAAAATGLRLAAALHYYWHARGLIDFGLQATLNALARSDRLPGDTARFRALGSASSLLHLKGQHAQAMALAEDQLALATALGSSRETMIGHLKVGFMAVAMKRWDQAGRHLNTCITMAQEIGSLRCLTGAWTGLGGMAVARGDLAEAASLYAKALAAVREGSETHNLVLALLHSSLVGIRQERAGDAGAWLREAASLLPALDSRDLDGALILQAAQLLALAQRWDSAVRLHAASSVKEREMGIAPCPDDAGVRCRNLAAARSQLGDAVFDAAWSEGLNLDHGAAMSLAIGELQLFGRETPP